jgi:hypothetical protein
VEEEKIMASPGFEQGSPQDNKFVSLDKHLWDDRELYTGRMEDVAKYVAPELEDIDQKMLPGQNFGKDIWDGTARGAAELFTNGITGQVVSEALRWFRLSFMGEQKELNEVREARLWLDEAEDAIYGELSSAKSNFYRETWPLVFNGATVSPGFMMMIDDFTEDRILFETVHPGQIAISEGADSNINTVSRRYRPILNTLVERFGLENLPDALQEKYKQNPFERVDITHMIVPRETFDPRMKNVENMPFASVWMYKGKVFRESGMPAFRGLGWRYSKIGVDIMGTSPAIKLLPDIKTLNKMGKSLLKAGALAAEPPMNVHADQQGLENFAPRGLNYFTSSDQKASPVDTIGQYPIGIDREEARQQMIREAYSVDFFLIIAQADREMTATEVATRQQEKSVILAPMINRFTYEFLRPLIDNVFDILVERGRMPEMPGILQEFGADIDIEFVGPLAQAQKIQLAGSPIKQTMSDAIATAEVFGPQVLDNFNGDKISRKLAEINGMPEELMTDEAEVVAKRTAEAEAAAEQIATEQANMQSQTLKNVTEASPAVQEQLDREVNESAGAPIG